MMIVEQFGFAMIPALPPFKALMSSGFTSGTTSGTDVVNLQWGETGIVANGSDDDRDVMIEVRNVSGTCAVGQNWTLALIGNQ